MKTVNNAIEGENRRRAPELSIPSGEARADIAIDPVGEYRATDERTEHLSQDRLTRDSEKEELDKVETALTMVSQGNPTAAEVRTIYTLLIDRFEHLDFVLRSTPAQPAIDQLEADKTRIKAVLRRLCN